MQSGWRPGKGEDARGRPTDLVTSGFAVLRTPLLPISELGLELDPVAAPGVIAEYRDMLDEAIRVASPAFWTTAVARDDPHGPPSPDIARSLGRYHSRAASRPTPYGLFATWARAEIGSETRLSLAPLSECRRCTRLDVAWVSWIIGCLMRDTAIRQRLSYRRNPSVYQAMGRIRYFESPIGGAGGRYLASSVGASSIVTDVLNAARSWRAFDALARVASSADPELTSQHALDLIDEMITVGLLIPQLALAAVGGWSLEDLASKSSSFGCAAPVVEHLHELAERIRTLDMSPFASAEAYSAFDDTLDRLAQLIRHQSDPEPPGTRLHVDLLRPGVNLVIAKRVAGDMLTAIDAIVRLGAPKRDDLLRPFRERLQRHFGDAEVPLLLALDEELGLGFEAPHRQEVTHPLTRDLDLEWPETRIAWTQRERLLHAKLSSLRPGQVEIDVSIEELQSIEQPYPLPDSLFFQGSILASCERDVDLGNYHLLFDKWDGPSGVRFLGRVLHMDSGLEAEVRKHVGEEQAVSGDARLAEVVHLPGYELRMGNVIQRPRLREYEIDCLGPSNVPDEYRIDLDDLLISVADGKLVLRSKRLGCEIRPRMTNAHNFTHPLNLAAYRFLCTLQLQSQAYTHVWSWSPFSQRSFYPRVKVGRVILTPAMWRIPITDMRTFRRALETERPARLAELRDRHQLPKWVSVEGTAVNLEDPKMSDACLTTSIDSDHITVHELLPAALGVPVHGCEGRYIHDVIVPFVRRRIPSDSSASVESKSHRPEKTSVQRSGVTSFPPGSGWLYIAASGGHAAVERFLLHDLKPVLDEVNDRGERWFFVRYGDPDWHLRLRIEGCPDWLMGEIWPKIQVCIAPMREAGLIRRLCIDTYMPEIDRYGGVMGLNVAESIFAADSRATVALLRAQKWPPEERALLAVTTCDRLLTSLGLDARQQASIARALRDRFFEELAGSTNTGRKMGRLFRDRVAKLEAMRLGHLPGTVAAILDRRDAEISPYGEELSSLYRQGKLERHPDQLALSFCHLHCNRILDIPSRPIEMVIYNFLSRLHEKRNAMNR